MIEVESTVNMRFITYQVLGRGDIIISRTIEIENQQSHTFSFLASFAMVPKAQVIVYTVRNDEMISDHIEIDFGNDLQNFLTIEVNADQASPGQEVDITVISKPNSYVGLLGVDQSLLLLRKGNDLEKAEIFDELAQYEKKNSMNRMNENNWVDFNVRDIYSELNISLTDIYFQEAGTVLLANVRAPERSKLLFPNFIFKKIYQCKTNTKKKSIPFKN